MTKPPTNTIKFLCSYGGKIVPRHTDGLLRYSGGHTRFLAVDRSISFSELMVKVEELCGSAVAVRCQLPEGDLETLVSVKSDEDLANIIEEYDRASRPLAVRTVLSLKKPSPSSSLDSDHSPRKFGFSPPNKPLIRAARLPYYPFASAPVEVKSRFSYY